MHREELIVGKGFPCRGVYDSGHSSEVLRYVNKIAFLGR